MLILYMIVGLVIFWYIWWSDRKHIEDMLMWVTAGLGFGTSHLYYPSIVVLLLCAYTYYGFLMYR